MPNQRGPIWKVSETETIFASGKGSFTFRESLGQSASQPCNRPATIATPLASCQWIEGLHTNGSTWIPPRPLPPAAEEEENGDIPSGA